MYHGYTKKLDIYIINGKKHTEEKSKKIWQKVRKAHIPSAAAIIGHTTLISWNRIGHIKGLISNMWLILLYTVKIVINDVCTKFQNPRSNSS